MDVPQGVTTPLFTLLFPEVGCQLGGNISQSEFEIAFVSPSYSKGASDGYRIQSDFLHSFSYRFRRVGCESAGVPPEVTSVPSGAVTTYHLSPCSAAALARVEAWTSGVFSSFSLPPFLPAWILLGFQDLKIGKF